MSGGSHYHNKYIFLLATHLSGGLGLCIGASESVAPSLGDMGERGVAAWSRYSRRRTSLPHERKNNTASACDMLDIGVSFTCTHIVYIVILLVYLYDD